MAAGVVVSDNSLFNMEVLGLIGFDFAFIDCEHSPISVESITRMVLSADFRGLSPLVRTPRNEEETILRYMDTGAAGIIIPGVYSAEFAEKAVKAVKYSPRGQRGLAGMRAADYGLSGPLGEYVKVANQETMVMGVLESIQGVENIDAILSVDGFDSVFIGTNDLSNSLGVPGQTNHPDVLKAIDRVLEAGQKTGKPIGGVVRGGETPQQYVAKGFRVVLTAVQSLLAASGKEFLKNARGE